MKNYLEKIESFFSKYENYLIWPILALAAFLRFRQLDDRDFWYDEAFTGIAIRENFRDMLTMIINDVHPPLYYWLTKPFASFFNYSVFGTRIFSAIFGLLCVWAVYLFARELFDRRTALWATLVAAVSPFAVQYSQEARMYVMLVFFILIGAYFFVRGIKTGKMKYFLWWGFFIGLSCLVHYMGLIFAIVFYPAWAAWRIISEKIYEQKASWKAFANFLPSKQIWAGYGIAFLVFSPWIYIFQQHLLNPGNNLAWVVPASLGDIFWNIQMFIFGTPKGEMSSGMTNPNEFWGVANNTAVGVLMIFFVAATFFLYKKRRDKEKIAALLMLSVGFLLLVYFFSLLGQQFFVARYLMPAAYFIFVYLGLWLASVRVRTAVYAFVIYITLMFTFQPYYYSQGWNLLEEDLSKYKGSHFYILNSFDYVIGKYYLGADHLTLYNIDYPQYNPSYWAAIGPTLKRTENFEDIKNDSQALIIFNGQPNLKSRDDKSFDPKNFVNVAQYKDIGLYRVGK